MKTAEPPVQAPHEIALAILQDMDKWGLLVGRATDSMRVLDTKARAKKLLKEVAKDD